ncbi:efflux RND transporter periplasmic adaptor subunit [Psychromonas arctica]|uniref:Efflux RND transporter periplasmic adaptor subunit n=1 Tax=Psychromonas arctica TaxID=168275 RepID=A0ABU9H7T9_9GAMM
MFTLKSSKGLLTFIFTFFLLGCGEQGNMKPRAMGPIHVDTITATNTSLRLSTELPGRISAFNEAEVRPQVGGIIKKRLFKEGSYVEAGDVLYQIDPVTYQASVNSSKAQLQKSISDQQATQKSFDRYSELLKKKLTSQQNYDDAYSDNQQALASVAIYQAELDNANVQLSYTKIKAPISGIIGLSQVSEGALVTAEQSSYLAEIIQSDQVYVDMAQSSVSLYALQKEFQIGLKDDQEKPIIPVKILLEDGSEYEHTGHLEFADAQVNDLTGSVTLRALIPNPRHTLLPGMFVRANVSSPEEREYIVLPQSLVIRSQSGAPYAYVVNDKNIVEKKNLTLGSEVNNGWVVKKGLVVGDRVVTNNFAKVKENIEVVIDSEDDIAKEQPQPASIDL